MKHRFVGSCHCGDVRLDFDTDLDPHAIEIRACQCGFCLRQGSEALSDPEGYLEIGGAASAGLRHYRFGHRLADYLFCARCGVYLGALTQTSAGLRGFTLLRLLDDRALFTREVVPVGFEGESPDERQLRRSSKWTPAVLGPRNSA